MRSGGVLVEDQLSPNCMPSVNTCPDLGICLPIFEEDICDMLTATRQNYVCIFGILMLDAGFLYLINDHFHSNRLLCIFFSFEKKSK